MAIKADELIRLRNEGAVMYEKMIDQLGIEEARKQLRSRVTSKVSIAVPPEEVSTSMERMKTIMYNNLSAIVYTVMHDEFGFGKQRLILFKQKWDELCRLLYDTSPSGHHYLNMVDLAYDLNKLYDMGIDVEMVGEIEGANRKEKRMNVAIDSMIGFLKQKGYTDAAKDIWLDVYGDNRSWTTERQSEVRKIAKQKHKEDRKYIAPNMYIFEPESIEMFCAMFGTAVGHVMDISEEQIIDICNEVNEMLSRILELGKKEQTRIMDEFSEKYNAMFFYDSDSEETEV